MSKAQELAFVERARKLAAGFPAGPLEPHERPDVRLRRGDEILGIEVTQIHQPDLPGATSQRLQEAEQHNLADEARRIAEAETLPAVVVTLHFNHHAPLRKSECQMLARQLVDVVSANLPRRVK